MQNIYLPVRKVLYFLDILVVITFTSATSIAQPGISYNAVINGLSSPVDVVNAGDNSNRVFVVQQGGTIRVYDQSFVYLGDFLTVSGISAGGERGLLSLAFHPDFKNNGFFFVYYTNTAGDIEIARYHVNAGTPNSADASSKSVVITIAHPGQSNHNGGKLNFGADGYLYFGTGDGGGGGDVPNNAQNGNSLLGKMIRIAVNTSATAPFYSIPPDNPYVGDPNVLDEVYDIGLRNPFRWSFDRLTHDMWIGDVGQDAVEEIDFRSAATTGGVNYGWRCYEGNQSYNGSGCGPVTNYVFPVFQYLHSGTAAVTGGMVYRGSSYSNMSGYYFANDVYTGVLYLLHPDGSGGWISNTQTGLPGAVVGYGEMENGEMLAVSLNGSIYQVQSTALVPLKLVDWTGQWNNNAVVLQWRTAFEQNLQQFDIESGTDGSHFATIGSVPAVNNANGHSYQFNHTPVVSFPVYYRLHMIDVNGHAEYSTIITVYKTNTSPNSIYPTVIHNGVLQVNLSAPFQRLDVFNTVGSLVFSYNLAGQSGWQSIALPSQLRGTYLVQLISGNRKSVQKIIVE